MASTSSYYKSNPEARKKRLTQQKKYNKTKRGLAIRVNANAVNSCLLYTSPSPRDVEESRMPSSA